MRINCGTSVERQKGIENASQNILLEGNERIGGLESEINNWQKSLGSKASVTHTSTAMTEHNDEAKGWQTRLAVTIWYEL
jgi:hypothetical protein